MNQDNKCCIRRNLNDLHAKNFLVAEDLAKTYALLHASNCTAKKTPNSIKNTNGKMPFFVQTFSALVNTSFCLYSIYLALFIPALFWFDLL